jgi:hypothetical protein
MNRKSFAALTALMWIALPFTILRYARVWNQLPVNMATHFNAAGEPNGWMPRLTSLYFALGLTAFMLVIFTAMAVLVLKQKSPPDAPTFALLGFFYLILGGVYSVNSGLVEYNLTGKPVTVAPLLLGLPISIVLFVLVYLRARRGAPLPQETILAEESHGSRLLGGAFLLFGALQLYLCAALPQNNIRLVTGLLSIVFLLLAAHAWTGFHYRFTPAGVEISTLGLRLRSIPQGEITKYRVEKWTAPRGYGIRGLGNVRAYVWGNDVVHISTVDGEVFLGHKDPARLVRDLDAVKQYGHS